MTNLDSFSKTVQTFGAKSELWEYSENEDFSAYLETTKARQLLQEEGALDKKLDFLQPPALKDFAEQLFIDIMKEQNKTFVLLLVKNCAWLCVLMMIGGFYLGWQETQQDYTNTLTYFDSYFEEITY